MSRYNPDDKFDTYMLDLAAYLMYEGKELFTIKADERHRTFRFDDPLGCTALYHVYRDANAVVNLQQYLDCRTTLKTMADEARAEFLAAQPKK